MIACGNIDNGFSSVGARTLSGTGYRGHIFWDTEIFMLPFYVFTFPKMARNILLYRYRRLDEARKLAKAEGYNGAKFPWESAASGDEQTPGWARDINGKIVRIHTHEMEHHITADIAYALYKYYVATGDEKFMQNYGYEIIFETARFWASRVVLNKRTNKYDIPNVIGPDEFHISVKNNAFTNMMAKWNLLIAYELSHRVKKDSKTYWNIKQKINLIDEEVNDWHRIASRIACSINKNNVIEQFDGYFKLKKHIVVAADENGLPILPKQLSTKDMRKTQLIKQADVLMLLVLLDDAFGEKMKKVNYDYYSDKTVHGSSLSAAMHCLIACKVKDMQRGYSFFNTSLRADISNIYGNTDEGIHAASLGGTWQALIFGFAGIKIDENGVSVDPYMPKTWGKMIFSLLVRGDVLYFQISHRSIKLKLSSAIRKSIKISVAGKKIKLIYGKWRVVKRKVPLVSERYFY